MLQTAARPIGFGSNWPTNMHLIKLCGEVLYLQGVSRNYNEDKLMGICFMIIKDLS